MEARGLSDALQICVPTRTGTRFVVGYMARIMVAQATPISRFSTTRRPSVVIVEDEQASRRALSVLLSICGYQPQAFASAEEALRSLEGSPFPRVALVDLDLPGMSGADLIRRMKRLQPSAFPILITASDDDTLAAQLRGLPVVYLRKPVDFDMLLGLLKEQHQGRRF